MLEETTLYDSLLLHFIFIKRSPFLICGFLDSDEFKSIKDFAPQCQIYDSLDPMGMHLSDEEGIEILHQLMEAESEDPIEGQKNVIMVNQASANTIGLIIERFDIAWMASTVMPARDAAKRYNVPVYDLKTANWINFDKKAIDLTWESSLLQMNSRMELRLKLKEIFHDAVQIAMFVMQGEVGEKTNRILEKYKTKGAKIRICEICFNYFHIDTKHIIQTGNIDRKTSNDLKKASHDNIIEASQDRGLLNYEAEYEFLSKNILFKRAVISILEGEKDLKSNFTGPKDKYLYLREKGQWKGGLPIEIVVKLLKYIVRDCSSQEKFDHIISIFSSTMLMFNLSNKTTINELVTKISQEVNFKENTCRRLQPVVEQRKWTWIGAPPRDANQIWNWMEQAIASISKQTTKLEKICIQKGLLGFSVPQFKAYRLPQHAFENPEEARKWLIRLLKVQTKWLDNFEKTCSCPTKEYDSRIKAAYGGSNAC